MKIDNVFSFPDLKAAIDEIAPLDNAHHQGKKVCFHKRRTVDKQAREVRCRDCEVTLDPITVLSEIAHEFGNWKTKQLKEEVVRLQELERKIEAKVKSPERRTPEEMACTTWMEFKAMHECDPEKMWRKGDMINCYCGSAFNRHSFPLKAFQVFEAHERLARKAGFELKKWADGKS